MKHEFDSSHEKYIEITVSSFITQTGIIHAVFGLREHPDYLHKHSLWIFSNFSLGININELKGIADIFRHYKPKKTAFANKSALVVSGQTYKSLLNLFATIATDMPFEFQAFTDKDKAIDFLCSE